MRTMLLACCTVIAFAGFATTSGALADPPAGKGGKGADKGQSVSGDRQYGYDGYDDGGKDKGGQKGNGNGQGQQGAGDDKDNHGQHVSECNQRANHKNLKGRDRKEFVDWCVDRGERYGYDDQRWSQQRACYRMADDRNLSGDKRRRYLDDCINQGDGGKQGKSKH